MSAPAAARGFDVARVRAEIPALHQLVHGKPLVYLDSAATMLKPESVIEAEMTAYRRDVANVHRGVHRLSERATAAFEASREKTRAFLGAGDAREIVFTRGTTESINLVAQSFGLRRVGPGDEILITAMEHHSNIVPWQMLVEAVGANLVVVPITDAGEVVLDQVEELLGPRTRLLSVAHVSNALGTVNPVAEIVAMAHARGIPVLVDGAQAAGHMPVDVRALGCDFYAFSGHKVCGPTGVGVLWGRAELLEEMPPWQGGGEMIRSVTFARTTYAEIPAKFEAGTPNIAGVIGLGAALDYVEDLGRAAIQAHGDELLEHATAALGALPGLRIVGTARRKAGAISFVMEGVHPHDVGTIVDREGVAVRTGHLCAQPVMERFGVPAVVRASFAFYNDREDVERLVVALRKVREIFA